MNIKLVTWTERPTETIAWAFANMHNPIPDNLNDFITEQTHKLGTEKWSKVKEELLEVLAINPHSSVLEFVNTVWFIGGCSRAFQQQLTRSRDAAYSIQSLRIVDRKDFADKKDYQVGPTVKGLNEILYHKVMKDIQSDYNTLIGMGVKTEDARGILPLNINSPITMAINLRALQHLLEVRLCNLAQGEYREVGKCMVEEMGEKMGRPFTKLFQKPCDRHSYCPMPINCGKTKYKLDNRYEGKHLEHWLKG